MLYMDSFSWELSRSRSPSFALRVRLGKLGVGGGVAVPFKFVASDRVGSCLLGGCWYVIQVALGEEQAVFLPFQHCLE